MLSSHHNSHPCKGVEPMMLGFLHLLLCRNDYDGHIAEIVVIEAVGWLNLQLFSFQLHWFCHSVFVNFAVSAMHISEQYIVVTILRFWNHK